MNEEEIVLTPMMKQFLDLKAKHPDAVMLFRCGDFYETYSTDAIVASEILGITLTKRANGKGKTIEMAGFPHHALDTLFRISAASFISTIKVDSPTEILSLAPTRVKILSTRPIWALSAGTNEPICANSVISAV